MTQKQEDLLSISLQVTENERRKSPDLEAGYSQNGEFVEVIVRFTGDISYLQEKYQQTQVIQLLNNYGIIIALKENIEGIIAEDSIEYAEKPKLLYFELSAGKSASCINTVQLAGGIREGLGLYGEGTIVAVIDTGERVIIMSS